MNPVTGLSLGRIAVGIVAFARPDVVGKLLQLDPGRTPQLAFVARLAGSRDVALGLLTLLTRGRTRRALVVAGIAVDAADAATGWLAVRDDALSKKAAAGVITPALGAVGAGIAGLRRS